MSKLLDEAFVRWAKHKRHELGWTSGHLSSLTNMTQGTISRVETGQSGATMRTLVAFTVAYDYPFERMWEIFKSDTNLKLMFLLADKARRAEITFRGVGCYAKEQRQKTGLSLRAMGGRVSVSGPTIMRFESGCLGRISANLVAQYDKALGFPGELFGRMWAAEELYRNHHKKIQENNHRRNS